MILDMIKLMTLYRKLIMPLSIVKINLLHLDLKYCIIILNNNSNGFNSGL